MNEHANRRHADGRYRPQSRRWYGYMDIVAPQRSDSAPVLPSRLERHQPKDVPSAKAGAPVAVRGRLVPISGIAGDSIHRKHPVVRSAHAVRSTQGAKVAPPNAPIDKPSSLQTLPSSPAVTKQSEVPGRPKRRKSTYVLYVLAVILFLAGGFLAWQGFVANKRLEAQIVQTSGDATDDGSRPSTEPVHESAVDAYTVAPTMPRVLTIEKLGVKARIMPLGVTASNKLKAPSNVYDVGWYNASALPGQAGAMLLDGHVSSWSTAGVFKNLHKLSAGDVISIERGDGQKLQYKVVRAQTYEESQTDMQAALSPITPGKNGLNLITCHGEVRAGTSEFSERLIVFAEQI